MMRRPTRTLLIVFGVLAASVMLLATAELAYRQRTVRRSGRGVQVRYYPHARLQRALVRNADYADNVHINRFGFRGAEIDLVKEPGTTRIMVLGASTTFDSCINRDGDTWPARLEHWLEQLVPGRRFEVINAGVPGMPMSDHLIRFQTELYAFEPDIVIVYAGHGVVTADDAVGPAEDGSSMPDAALAITPWERWLQQHSLLYDRVRPDVTKEPMELAEEQWAAAVDNAARSFRRQLSNLTLIALDGGAAVVFVEINRVTGSRTAAQFTAEERAAWRLFPAPADVVIEGYRTFGEVWRSVASSTGATFIAADSIGITGAQNYCAGDAIHFNSAGADAMGRRLAERLLASALVTRPPASSAASASRPE